MGFGPGLKRHFRRCFPERTGTDFPGGYIPAYFIAQSAMKGDKGRALIIGDQFGHDYKVLKPLFDEVKAIDVVDNGMIPAADLILQDASKVSSLESESFDFIVARNVIEHMFGDYDCICEMNRLLRPGARFFIDVPFLSDKPFFHFRVFTPRIFNRMMEAAGYRLVEMRYRGLSYAIGNNLVAGIAVLLKPIFGNGALELVNRAVLWAHMRISRSYRPNSLNPDHFGGMLLYEKVGAPQPEVEVQIKHFGVLAKEPKSARHATQ